MSRVTVLVVAVGLLMAAVAVPVSGQDSDNQPEPELEVTYEEFRTSDTLIQQINETGKAEYVKQNTRVRVEEADAFARIQLENPNSYATAFEVQLSEAIVDPATLGQVGAVDSDTTATWEATHDFDSEETYTRMTVVVPAETTLLFAPSQLRIKSLAWTGDAQQQADGFRDRLASVLDGNDTLQQRQYGVTGDQGEMVTIELENPETGERIESWQATYQLEGEHQRHPLAQGSGEPVFYRSLKNEAGEMEAIQITFNEPGSVRLVVKPTTRERIGYDYTSYRSSVLDTLSLPFIGQLMIQTANRGLI